MSNTPRHTQPASMEPLQPDSEQQQAEKVWALVGELRDDPDIVTLLQAAKQPRTGGAVGRGWSTGLAIAATLLLVWGASLINLDGTSPPSTLVLTAAAGEPHTAELPDSSTAVLNSGTRLIATFNDSSRVVTLLEGEATFNVNRDGRVFEVHTPEGIIRVLGTVFNVHLTDNGTAAVSVLEGKVRVEGSKKYRPSLPVELTSGQAINYDYRGLSAVKPADTERILSWHSGRIRFQQWTVAEVIEEYNRHTPNKLRVEGGEGVLLSGSFTLENKQEFIATLESTYAVRVYPLHPNS